MKENQLRGKRVGAGYTQAEMAKLLFMSKATYGRKENNQEKFKLPELQKISEILNEPIESIFGSGIHAQ